MVLSCNNISKEFVTGPVLKEVSFHINEREKAAIVGINGAGKSTLLKIIMNEMSADSGEVFLAKIFVIRSFFAKNGYLLIFFACQKIINSLASKLASNYYTFDTCIILKYSITMG